MTKTRTTYWQAAAAEAAYRSSMAASYEPDGAGWLPEDHEAVEVVETVTITSREDLEAYFASVA